MGEFDGSRWHCYLDQEAQKRRDEIENHLKTNYDGPSDFIKEKLMEEEVLSIEEQIKQKEADIQDTKKDLKRLKQIKQEREQQDKLNDKKELLKKKQQELKKFYNAETRSREEIREEIVEKRREKAKKSPKVSDVEEFMSQQRVQNRIEQRVEKELKGFEDVDSLVEDVQRLQKQVSELNGGREDWFMDLEQEKVEADA